MKAENLINEVRTIISNNITISSKLIELLAVKYETTNEEIKKVIKEIRDAEYV